MSSTLLNKDCIHREHFVVILTNLQAPQRFIRRIKMSQQFVLIWYCFANFACSQPDSITNYNQRMNATDL